MADEPTPGKDQEIEAILRDLDVILSDLNDPAPEAKPPASAPAVPAAPDLKIELSAREGSMPSAPKKTEPPKPAPMPQGLTSHPPLELSAGAPAPAPAAPALKPAAPPPSSQPPAPCAPAPSGAASSFDSAIPDKTPKDQIRRVALLFEAGRETDALAFSKFLDQSGQTISKRPLFLRKVVVEAFKPGADARALATRAQSAGVVAVLGLAANPEACFRDAPDVFAAAGITFHNVAIAEMQKRSVAVDLIVDLMLLSPEA